MNSLNGLPLNYFDFIAAVWLIVGILVGRKRGMSQELLPMLKWICIVVAAALLYKPFVGVILRNTAKSFDLLWATISAYVLIAIVIASIFQVIKNAVGEKLVGSDIFGSREYYLGMLGGLVHFACILIVLLAIMNSRVYTQAEIDEEMKVQKKNFEEIQFPTYATIQHAVLVTSMTGSFVRNDLGILLIQPLNAAQLKHETIAKKQEQTINDILGSSGGAH